MEVVLSPRGSERRTVDVKDIKVPDLWHLAMAFTDLADGNPVEDAFHRPADSSTYAAWSKMAVEVWHLASDLLYNLQNLDRPIALILPPKE